MIKIQKVMIKIQDINTKEIIVGNTMDYGELTDIKKDTLHNIYIDKGDCLQEDSVNDKIKSIRNLLEEVGA